MSQASVIPLRQKATAQKKADKKDLELLLAAWKHEKAKRDISLQEMAVYFKINYETVRSTYKGIRSVTSTWKLRFATYLDRYPQDIWPDWEFKHMTTGTLSPQSNLIALKAHDLSVQARKFLLLELDQLSAGTMTPESAQIALKANLLGAEARKMFLAQLDQWSKLEGRKARAVPIKD
jgi:hypothetical protein